MKKSPMKSAALCLAALFFTCGNPTGGNGSGAGNPILTGKLYLSDGTTPAAGAKVLLVPVDHNPRGLAKTAVAAPESTTTDANGVYKLDSVPEGTYNVLASADGSLAFQDSIAVDPTDTVAEVPPDTLKAPGSLRGVIKLQPGDDARKVFIIAMGTNTFAAPEDSVGNFSLVNMAEGQYSVRILSVLDDYGVLDTSFTVRAGTEDTLTDTISLPYTGIPVPTGLDIRYDTLKQVVMVTWDKPDSSLVKGFNVFRRNVEANAVFKQINTSVIMGNLFLDSTLSQNAQYEYAVSSLDHQNNEGKKSIGISVYFGNRISLVTDSAEFGVRSAHTILAYNNKIWIIAGGLFNDVWSSVDGISWEQVTNSAAFSGRSHHASVVFNKKIWVIGGRDETLLQDDVWYSDDGINWVLATDSAGFSGRMNHSAVVFKNKIWVIGGYDGDSEKNDIWQSDDGIVWIKVTDSANFAPRAGFAALEFRDRLFVIGGAVPRGLSNDIWSSSDGITWTEIAANGNFTGRTDHTVTVFQNQIWLIGGETKDGNSNEVWSSNNGVVWEKFNPPNNFTAIAQHASIVFDNRLWIVGRAELPNGSLNKIDIWNLR